MKRSIARAWTKALESGEYEQTKGALRRGDKFCVLGVLCNLHAQAHPEIAAKEKVKSRYMGYGSLLPNEVVEWAGMNSNDGYITYNSHLVNMNDIAGNTFEEMAQVIRKRWKQL
jgi:hypothetical protein